MATQFDFGTRVSVNFFLTFCLWHLAASVSLETRENILWWGSTVSNVDSYTLYIRSIERLTSTFPYLFYSPKVSENQKFEEKNNDERFMLSKNTLSSQPKKKHCTQCTVRSQGGPNLWTAIRRRNHLWSFIFRININPRVGFNSIELVLCVFRSSGTVPQGFC